MEDERGRGRPHDRVGSVDARVDAPVDPVDAECGSLDAVAAVAATAGAAGEADCAELIHNLFLLLDGELGEGTCADLQEHLERCHGCLQRFGVERAFKELIRRRCGHEPVPQLLIERIQITLRTQIR